MTTFPRITLVSVTGLPDARGAAMALQHSQAQMPGSQAVLCSPTAPDDLAPSIRHVAIAPMNYHEYSWRCVSRPKFDITSLGHWSGSGLIDWNGRSAG